MKGQTERIHIRCGGRVIEAGAEPVPGAVPMYRFRCLACRADWWESETGPTDFVRIGGVFHDSNGCPPGRCLLAGRDDSCNDAGWNECHALHRCDGLCGCAPRKGTV